MFLNPKQKCGNNVNTVLLIVITQIISFATSFAQSRSFAGLPILNPKKQVNYLDNLNQTPEFTDLLAIYERLVEAKGDRRMPVPSLNLRNDEAYVASMDYRLLDISFEKKAYDICKKYGDGAFAFLLAHELVHYYEKHGWKSQFVSNNSDLETGKLLNLINDDITNEVQADVLGGFLSFSAGFGVFDKAGLLIDDLYSAYGMKDKIEGYPSKSDRKKLSERNKEEVMQLANQYEMAGLLTIIGKYKEAYQYYGYLLNQYQSRELYNNAGLTCMLAAISKSDPEIMIFEVPGMLDLEFSGDSRSASNSDEIERLLNEAITHFETAILMNKKYLMPYINLASVNLIKAINQTDISKHKILLEKVRYILNIEIKELKENNPELDFQPFDDEILILQSLLAYYDNNELQAKAFMLSAAEMNNEVAIANLNIMLKKPKTKVAPSEKVTIDMDDMTALKFQEAGMVSRNLTRLDDNNLFRFVDQQASNYKVLMHEFKGNDLVFGYDLAFLISKEGLTKPFFQNLTSGSNKSEAIALWGNPKKSLAHLNGEILLFSNEVILITDSIGKITKVIDYSEILK